VLEEKHYICGICGTAYRSSHACNKCKESHHNPVGIVSAKYSCGASKYPTIIHIRMDDREVVRYERQGG